jgi:hypothetical protein
MTAARPRHHDNERWRTMTRNGTFSSLSARQQQGILCLLSEPNIAAAAAQAHVARRTLFRWLQEATFQEAYRAAKAEAFAHAMALASAGCGKAVTLLIEVVGDPQAPTGARVRAAQVLIEFAKAETLEDLDARLKRLEAIVRQQNGGPAHGG